MNRSIRALRAVFVPVQARAVPLLACGLLAPALACDAQASDDALWRALGEGGRVVLVRHAPVVRGAEGGDPLRRAEDCAGEQRLSDAGREAAARLGARFRARDIPVARVLHSPYCRTAETARLAFGTVEPAADLALIEAASPDEARRRTEALRGLIEAHAGPGNLVLVTHEPNINAVSFELVSHLDAVVIDPAGPDAFEELGVLRFGGAD